MTFWIKMTFLPVGGAILPKGVKFINAYSFCTTWNTRVFLCVSKMTNFLLFGQKKRIENIICAIIKNGEFGNI